MASTTLVTFLLQSNRKPNSIHLLGSWDNFTKAYPMRRDTSLGNGHWRGCHSFTGIICDGDDVRSAESQRNGGLLMGGRYWYYYMIDDDIECHDPTEPSTTSCPFLPGQEVNVLEVPVQVNADPQDSRPNSDSTASSIYYTLDPEDKYRTPKPPTPLSETGPQSRITELSDAPEVELPEFDVLPVRPADPVPEISVPMHYANPFERPTTPPYEPACYTVAATRSPSTRTSPSRLRRWRSVITGASKAAGVSTVSIPRVPSLPGTPGMWSCRNHTAGSSGYASSELDPSRPASRQSSRGRSEDVGIDSQDYEYRDLSSQGSQTVHATEEKRAAMPIPIKAMQDSSGELLPDLEAIHIDDNVLSTTMSSKDTQLLEPSSERFLPTDVEDQEQGAGHTSGANHASETHDHTPHSDGNWELHHSTSIISSRTSGVFSSVMDGSTTSWLNSQPLTPTFSDFDDFLLDTSHVSPTQDENGCDMGHLETRGFNGYNLPETDHASALTLRNLETATSKSSQGEKSLLEPTSMKDFVEKWNETSGKSALQELVDDLGYLGKMIA